MMLVEASIMGVPIGLGPLGVKYFHVIPGGREATEPGISRFPAARLRTCGLVLRTSRE